MHNISDFEVNINCGTNYNGFLYILLHESTHLVDYIERITPYVEDEFKDEQHAIEKNHFVNNVWQNYNTPIDDYNFTEQKNITFYNINNGPKIKITDAVKTYQELSTTPFVSLYGSQNWAEDLAEYMAFYHLTQILKQPFDIQVYENKKRIYQYEPFSSRLVLKRYDTVKQFYQ